MEGGHGPAKNRLYVLHVLCMLHVCLYNCTVHMHAHVHPCALVY